MLTNTTLLEKRVALKREILDSREKILSARLFSAIGRWLGNLTPRKEPFSWVVGAVVIAILSCLPAVLLYWLLGEVATWNTIGLFSILATLMSLFSALVFHLSVRFALNNLHDHIVDSLIEPEDLDDLQTWLDEGCLFQKPIRLALVGAVLWPLISGIWLSLAYGRFAGFGYLYAAIFFGSFSGVGFFYSSWMQRLPPHLGRYRYFLHDVDPVHSEVISHLSYLLTRYVYILAGTITVFSLVISLIGGPEGRVVMSILFLSWVALAQQFILNQNALGKIISTAKWKTLSEIQAEIRALRTGGKLAEKETTESINQLMDLHERIRNTQNSALDLRAGLNFLNQLMLPLLGLILANLDQILRFFNLR